MKVVFAGGGTSGHVNPAISIANEIRRRDQSSEIIFIGTKRGLESVLVPKEGYEIKYIKVRGISRSLSPSNILAGIQFIYAVAKCKRILKKIKPDAVCGTGGYVCGPVLYAAAKLKIKTYIHESNAYCGMTTKFLAKYVDKIMIGMPLARKIGYENKIILTGNPIKKEILQADVEAAKNKYKTDDKSLVVSIGGSRGARTINNAVSEIFHNKDYQNGFLHIHATGKTDYNEFIDKISDVKSDNLKAFEYIYDTKGVYNAADVIVCRAGAITLAEVCALGKAAIIVPSPNVTDNHQFYNAKMLADKGACIMIKDEDFNGKTLYDTICSIAFNSDKKKQLEKNALSFAKPKALDTIVDIITEG